MTRTSARRSHGGESPERAAASPRAVLEERARLLAKPHLAVRERGASIDVVTFDLARERYAVEARYVREIARLADLTPVPGTPPFVAGATTRRGEILAVFDLRVLLGVDASGLNDLSWLLVLGEERAELGVLADAAHDVIAIEAGEVVASASGARVAYRRGVTRGGLVMLDGAAILGDRSLFLDEGTDEAAVPGGVT